LEQLKRQLATFGEEGNVELETLQSRIAALEEDVAQKKRLIESMQEKLLSGGGQLPVELTSQLADLANKYDMISYDANRGVLKFESDLTFEPGSDQVTTTAANGVKSLCTILNSSEAVKFDVTLPDTRTTFLYSNLLHWPSIPPTGIYPLIGPFPCSIS